jgi:septum formation protein
VRCFFVIVHLTIFSSYVIIHIMRQLILASSSPRRKELMEFLGIPFDVKSSDFPEEEIIYEECDGPQDYVLTVAAGKALTVAQEYHDALILSADTMVFLDGQPYGKPKDLDDARRILQTLRGKTHEVHTALCIVDTLTGDKHTEVVQSFVEFFPFSDDELERFISTSEPLGKAGAYAIQGGAKALAKSVQGSVSNVVGLPLLETASLLEQVGLIVDVNVRDIEERLFTHDN